MQFELSIIYGRLHQIVADFFRVLPNIGIGIVALLLFVVAARGVKVLVQRLSARSHHQNLAMVFGRLAQWAMLLLGVLVAVTISFPSFTPANLISALGITGIAIGFAFKDIFENFLAGILILTTEPFRIDDQIVFGAYEGTIESIETRATKLRMYDGRLVVIPNADLFKASVIVNTASASRRLEYDVGIGNGDDIQSAKKLMLEVVRNTEGVVADPTPDALVVDFGDSSVKIRVRWWINPPRRADALDIKDKILEAIKAVLTKNGIDLPFPTYQVLFHDQTEETDGDRSRQREGWPAGQSEVPAQATIAKAMLHGHRRRNGPDGAFGGNGDRRGSDGQAAQRNATQRWQESRFVVRSDLFEQVETQVQSGVGWLRLLVETLGAMVIAAGVVVAVAGLVRYFASREGRNFAPIRLSFARYLTLALELQLAADILSTSVAPTWDRIGKLAAIAVIRTALNYFLSQEMKGETATVEPAPLDLPSPRPAGTATPAD